MASFGPLGGVPVPGAQFGRPGFPGAFPGAIRPGFGGDANPITPGNQVTPGVVTATGPSQFVQEGLAGRGFPGVGPIPGQPGFVPGQPGFFPGAVGVAGGVVDADPITPGIQAQPGVVTPVGPPRFVGGAQQGAIGGIGGPIGSGVVGGFNTTTRTVTTGLAGGLPIGGGYPVGIGSGIAGGVVDADPITPGIQTQPGVVTAVGAPRVVGSSIATGGLGFDADPITPGVQAQAGVLTATGPSTVVGGGMLSSGVISGPPLGFQTSITPAPVLTSGIRNTNFGGLVDADPITPGIQLQPGTITQTGPSTVVGGGFVGNSFAAPLVDADPITPGIQAQAGVITATGPSTFTTGYQQAGYQQLGYQQTVGGYQQVVGGGLIDADPITPGIQAQAGVITPTGPPVVVGYSNQNQNCCPWWLLPLLCLLLLAGLLGGLYAYFSRRRSSSS